MIYIYLLVMWALIGIIWLIPFFKILKSDRTNGIEKLVWIIAMLSVSWFAWILYVFLAPIDKRNLD